MTRREFCPLVAGAATWPVAAQAQEPAHPQIGILNYRSAEGHAEWLAPLADDLVRFFARTRRL